MKRASTCSQICMAAAILLTIIAVPAIAVENGQPDAAYTNVGTLGIDFDGPAGPTPPFGLCSGFVLSDRAFVTAAHCIEQAGDAAVSWAVSLEPGTPDNPVVNPGVFDLTIFNITEFPILANVESTQIVRTHPAYNRDTFENDIAVLEFPAGTFSVPPVRLARSGQLTWLKHFRILKRIPIGVAGYGAEKALGNFKFFVPGFRKRGFSALGTLSRTRMTLEPTPIRDAFVLPGDSGSPQFVLGRVVSLTSFFDLQRLDIPSAQWFLRQYRH